MPTYDYKCTACNHTFEYFQPMSAAPLTECPQCKGNLRRIIGTGSGPIFKGSGFYQTDYKGKSQQSKKGNESENKPINTDTKTTKDDKK